MRKLDLRMDVTEAACLGEPAHVALTVHLPDPAGGANGVREVKAANG